MKTLNKTLSLVLVLVMVLGLFGVAGAAYKDQNEIKNTEAVETLTALNVINGKTEGNFDPKGIVTRAEMAKMICVALNGGVEPVLGTNATPTYKDIKGHWAEAYIEYCTRLGIVSGNGDSTFSPDATVTAVQAAKMVLVALGFDSKNEGFVGAGWEISVGVRASQKGLYEDLSVDPSAGLSRDNAAQLIYNGINAIMVKYDYKIVTDTNGQLTTVAVAVDDGTKTIASTKFSLDTVKGFLTGVSYNKDTKKYTYTFTTTINGSTAAGTFAATTADYTAFYGQYVEVIYKDEATDSIFGVRSVSPTVVKTAVGLMKEVTVDGINYVEANGQKYALEQTNLASTPAYVFASGATSSAANSANASNLFATGGYSLSSTVYLISSDANEKVDYAVVIPNTVAAVTYASSTSITAGTIYNYATANIADGVMKGDFVVATAAVNSFTGIPTVTKASLIPNVAITGTRYEAPYNRVLVGGAQWLPIAQNAGDAVELNATYNITHVNGLIYNLEKTSGDASLSNLVYLAGMTDRTNVALAQGRVYFTDGKSEVVNVTHVNSTTAIAVGSGAGTSAGLYSYVKTDAGYKLTSVGSSNLLGFDAYVPGGSSKSFTQASTTAYAKLDGYRIADDAVIFVVDRSGVAVATGEAINKWATASGTITYSALTTTVNGNPYIKAAYISFGSGVAPSTQGSAYAYIVSDPYTVSENGTNYIKFEAWNGTAKVAMTDKNATANLTKGDFVKYADLGGGYVNVETEVTPFDAAITSFDSKSINAAKTTGEMNTYNRATTTVYMYIDSKTGAGAASGEIAVAGYAANGARYANAKVLETGGTLNLVVYDVSNRLYNAGTPVQCGYTIEAAGTPTPTGATFALANGQTKACEGDKVNFTVTTSADATSNRTITVTPSGSNVDATVTTVEVADHSASGTVVKGSWVVARESTTAISGTVTLTATGTVS